MSFSKEFFALNLAFADRIRQLGGFPAELVLRFYTNLYVRFGLGTSLQPQHPVWQEYISGLSETTDPIDWTHQFALQHRSSQEEDLLQSTWGCFSYTAWGQTKIRLHFHNQEVGGISPLSKDRMGARIDELQLMFRAIKLKYTGTEITSLVGGSWLYNLEAYNRLFPRAYLASARPGEYDYPYLTLWGQFLDRHGQIRGDLANKFTADIQQQTTVPSVLDCFPLKVLYLEAPLQVFYEYYDIE